MDLLITSVWMIIALLEGVIGINGLDKNGFLGPFAMVLVVLRLISRLMLSNHFFNISIMEQLSAV